MVWEDDKAHLIQTADLSAKAAKITALSFSGTGEFCRRGHFADSVEETLLRSRAHCAA